MRVYDGYKQNLPGPISYVKGGVRLVADDMAHNYIYADSPIGNDASVSFSINLHDHTASLVVFGTDEYGTYFAKWYVSALKSLKLTHSLVGLRMKEEISLDQNIPDPLPAGLTPILFNNAVTSQTAIDNKWAPTTLKYIPTGSYMKNIAWQNGMLYQNGTAYNWTTDLWDVINPVTNPMDYTRVYYSKVSGQQIITLSPPGGDPANEFVSIHH